MFRGSLVALITPFDGKNRIDYDSLQRLIDFHVEAGTDGLVVAGTTGESATLTRTEHIELIERAVKFADGRLPVIAGTGSNSTAQTVDLSRSVENLGIDGVLVVVPYYNKPVQEGLYRHFMAVADAISTPVILYNVPGRTVADLQPETVARLSAHDNIVAIKEATGDIERLQAIQSLIADPAFCYLSGDDFTLRSFIETGGHGVITVSGNVAPRQVATLCQLAEAGDSDAAAALDSTLQRLNRALFVESNPIPVKWAVSQLGLAADHIRLPLTPFAGENHAEMLAAMREAGIDSE